MADQDHDHYESTAHEDSEEEFSNMDLVVEYNQVKRERWLVCLGILALAAVLTIAIYFLATGPSRSTGFQLYNVNSQGKFFFDCSDITPHLKALEQVAFSDPAFKGSRAVELGYNASVAYVKSQLEEAGCPNITEQYFRVPVEHELAQPTFSQQAPFLATYKYGASYDFYGFRYGGDNGYAEVQNKNISLITGDECDPATWATEYVADTIPLVYNNETNCTMFTKFKNAEDAGAPAVMAYVKGRFLNYRIRPIPWIYEEYPQNIVQIPQIQVKYSYYEYVRGMIASGTDVIVTISTNREITTPVTMNLFCNTHSGTVAQSIISGSHLDSVPEGPGLNDNGSGSSMNLALALRFLENQDRYNVSANVIFAWWAAEEIGLLGSRYYARTLSATEKAGIAAAYNFDMMASPNYVTLVYNGTTADEVNKTLVVPAQKLDEFFIEYMDQEGYPYTMAVMNGGSDYYSFLEYGVPSGGLATGASQLKTDEERSIYGGFADAQLDPCYHKSCDNYANINNDSLTIMGGASSYALQKLFMMDNVEAYLWKGHTTSQDLED